MASFLCAAGFAAGRKRRLASAFLFPLIAKHVAKFTRAFNEAALPLRPFLNGCGLVSKPVDCSLSQLRCLASASSGPAGWGRARESLLKQPADSLWPSWLVLLFRCPGVNFPF